MFNNSNGYSLADIVAATGGNNRNDGMWDNGAWWIIILFLFCFNGGMWGNGFGRGMGGQGAGSPAFQGTTTREEIAYGFDMKVQMAVIHGKSAIVMKIILTILNADVRSIFAILAKAAVQ